MKKQLLASFLIVLFTKQIQSQAWSSVGTGLSNGTKGSVNALT